MIERVNEALNDSGRLGFCYALQSDEMPGLVKIGVSRKHPLQRARELGAGSGVPNGFRLSYYRDYEDAFLAETALHEQFAEQRVNENREFFAVSLEEVVKAMDSLAARMKSEGVTGGVYDAEAAQIRRAWQEVVDYPTPWADLFGTFSEDSDELTLDQRSQCRILKAKLHGNAI